MMILGKGQSQESVASASAAPSSRRPGRPPKAAKASRSAQSLPAGTPDRKRKIPASRSEEPVSPNKKARSTPTPPTGTNEKITTEDGKAGVVDNGKSGEVPKQIPESDDIPFKIECPAKVQKKASTDEDVFRKTDDVGVPALKIEYSVRPGKLWKGTKNYSRVKLHEWELKRGDFCYLAKTEVMPPRPEEEEEDDDNDETSGTDPLAYERENLYLCMVLEAKAADPRHVYLRVVYLYWPEELPQGRLPYHGMKEVVLSNHMDIVDAHTIHSKIDVEHIKNEQDENLDGLHWRQTLDISHKGRGMKDAGVLSKLDLHCRCQQPSNPDKPMFNCKAGAEKCGLWNHEQCLIEDILDRAWKKSEQGTLGEMERKDNTDNAKVEEDNVIEVKPQKDHSPLRKAIVAGFENVKTAFGVGAASAMPTPETESDKEEKPITQVDGPRNTKQPKTSKSVLKAMAKRRKTGEIAPWQGALSATIDATGKWGKEGVLMAHVVDHRANNGQGQVVWTTPVRCLACDEMLA